LSIGSVFIQLLLQMALLAREMRRKLGAPGVAAQPEPA